MIKVRTSRALYTAAAVAFAGALAIATVSAQTGPRQRAGGPGRGFGPFPMLQRLDLTDAQREQIRSIVSEQRQGTPRQDLAALEKELRTAVMADTPDTARIEQLKASINEAHAAALNERVDLQLRIAQVLTPEQRQKAREAPVGPGVGRGRGAPGTGRAF